MTPINIDKPRVKILREHVALEQVRINFGSWLHVDRPGETVEQAARATCNSVACLGGWTDLLFNPNRQIPVAVLDTYGNATTSGDLLGLERNVAKALFYCYWYQGQGWSSYHEVGLLPEDEQRELAIGILDKMLAAETEEELEEIVGLRTHQMVDDE